MSATGGSGGMGSGELFLESKPMAEVDTADKFRQNINHQGGPN